MANKQLQELKGKNETELKRHIAETRERLRALSFDLLAGKVKNVSEIKSLKKSIARSLTFMKQEQSKDSR